MPAGLLPESVFLTRPQQKTRCWCSIKPLKILANPFNCFQTMEPNSQPTFSNNALPNTALNTSKPASNTLKPTAKSNDGSPPSTNSSNTSPTSTTPSGTTTTNDPI